MRVFYLNKPRSFGRLCSVEELVEALQEGHILEIRPNPVLAQVRGQGLVEELC